MKYPTTSMGAAIWLVLLCHLTAMGRIDDGAENKAFGMMESSTSSNDNDNFHITTGETLVNLEESVEAKSGIERRRIKQALDEQEEVDRKIDRKEDKKKKKKKNKKKKKKKDHDDNNTPKSKGNKGSAESSKSSKGKGKGKGGGMMSSMSKGEDVLSGKGKSGKSSSRGKGMKGKKDRLFPKRTRAPATAPASACFESRPEVDMALDTYLRDADGRASIVRTYGEIQNWCVSRITNFDGIFQDRVDFNEPLDGWDTSNAVSMIDMFFRASSFNQDISMWDVSNVESMAFMFAFTDAFNQDLSAWDTGSLVDVTAMFQFTTAFNGDLSGWDTSNVAMMNSFLESAVAYSRAEDLVDWDVSSVMTMAFFSQFATNFAANLCPWLDLLPTVTTTLAFLGTSCTFNTPTIPTGTFCEACV